MPCIVLDKYHHY